MISLVRFPRTFDEWWLELFSGHFSISVAEIAPVVTALPAWLAARNGRKVRLKIGKVEVEARSAEEVEKLLLRVKEFQEALGTCAVSRNT